LRGSSEDPQENGSDFSVDREVDTRFDGQAEHSGDQKCAEELASIGHQFSALWKSWTAIATSTAIINPDMGGASSVRVLLRR
jgi:hypothetical protein